MQCDPGQPVIASEENETKLWYTSSRKKYDIEGRFLKPLRMEELNYEYNRQFCVFSGNLGEYSMNKVPDLVLNDDGGDFRTGLYNLPVKFRQVFIRDYKSSYFKRRFKPGDTVECDIHRALRRLLNPKSGKRNMSDFIRYFLRPKELNSKCYGDLKFIVIPDNETYNSHATLTSRVVKSKREKSASRENIHQGNAPDLSVPNCEQEYDTAIMTDIRSGSKLMLSDVVRYLCAQHPDEYITLIVSACRCWHPDIPNSAKSNQCTYEKVHMDKYLRSFAEIDIKNIDNPDVPMNNPTTPMNNPTTPMNNPTTPMNNPDVPMNNPTTPRNNPDTIDRSGPVPGTATNPDRFSIEDLKTKSYNVLDSLEFDTFSD